MEKVRVTFRVDDAALERARAVARRRGTTLNDELRAYLAEYAAGRGVPATGAARGEVSKRSRPR